jgi:hypothetical protein
VPTSFVPPHIPRRERTYSDSELNLNAKDDRQIVKADAETTLDVLQNDEWRGTIFPTLLSVTQPAHGAARVVSQKVAYTPQSGFVGEDSFQYTVQYGSNRTSTATVTLQVSREARANP